MGDSGNHGGWRYLLDGSRLTTVREFISPLQPVKGRSKVVIPYFTDMSQALVVMTSAAFIDLARP